MVAWSRRCLPSSQWGEVALIDSLHTGSPRQKASLQPAPTVERDRYSLRGGGRKETMGKQQIKGWAEEEWTLWGASKRGETALESAGGIGNNWYSLKLLRAHIRNTVSRKTATKALFYSSLTFRTGERWSMQVLFSILNPCLVNWIPTLRQTDLTICVHEGWTQCVFLVE